jgi:hypothetical protein
MALHEITLTYGGLSVVFRNWRGSDLPRSRKVFVNESSYAQSGNLIKSGTSFELPYLWTIAADLYQTEYDKTQMIWEYLDYSRRNQRTQIAIDVNVTSNVFSSTAHPYQNGDVVTLSTTGTLPSPLVSTRDYWIVERATNSYKLALTNGGAAIDITTTGSSSVLNTQLFVRIDDESEEIAERNATSLTKTRSEVSGTTPRELNGGVYYYARFLADWVAPPEFGQAYSSVRYSPNNSVIADQVLIRSVALVLQDTGVKI